MVVQRAPDDAQGGGPDQPPAPLAEVDWRDNLAIEFEPLAPKGALAIYTEGGFLSQRLSNDLPVYRGPFCQNSQLPFDCNVTFSVDFSNAPRPQPFTPPEVAVKFDFDPGGLHVTKSDSNPAYTGPGRSLKTSFGPRFTFTLSENGPFKMVFTLKDSDTGINRVYDDAIQIEAKRPCV